jgi:hypothetical protein
MNRRNQILAGILLLQMILVAIVFWPRGSAETAGQPLFSEVEVDQITKFVVTAAGGEPTQLVKDDAGWVLADTDGFPVLTETLKPVLDQIVGLMGDRAVATTTSSQKRLEVTADDYEYLVEFELADGSQHQLYVGTSPSYGSTYVRADDQDEVYLSSLKSSDLGTGPSSWIDRVYLSVPTDEATALTLTNKQGTFQFEKSGDTWTMTGLPAGETLDTSKVTAILSSVSSLSMMRPLGKAERPEYGLSEPLAVLDVTTPGGIYVLKVGAASAEDSTYVISSSESPYYVRVSQYSLTRLVENDQESFLVQPTPVPTDQPTATP